MICDRPDCPIERKARALESMRSKLFSAQTETCQHCEMCNGKLICWERIVHTDKEGNVISVELRAKRRAA